MNLLGLFPGPRDEIQENTFYAFLVSFFSLTTKKHKLEFNLYSLTVKH